MSVVDAYTEYVRPVAKEVNRAFKVVRFTPLRMFVSIAATRETYHLWQATRDQAKQSEGFLNYAAHVGNVSPSIGASYFGALAIANMLPLSFQQNPRRMRAAIMGTASGIALLLNGLVETKTGHSILQHAPEWVPFSRNQGNTSLSDIVYGVAAGTAAGLLVYAGPRHVPREPYQDYHDPVEIPPSTLNDDLDAFLAAPPPFPTWHHDEQ